MDISPAALGPLRDLYARGHYRQALAAAGAFGPLRTWTGPAARLLGGRLAIQLGAPALGRRLHLLAFRNNPGYPEAVYYHARYRAERFGPLSAWEFMRDHPDWSDAPPGLRADWLALGGFVLARLRDFDRADRFLNQAEAVCPDRPWVAVERASALEAADRPADALQSGRRALELHPWFRPAVQAVGHLLRRRGRDGEAIDFLTQAADHLESGIVLAQLAAGQLDLGRPADARRSLEKYAELCPLLEKEGRKWLAARRADVAYLLGEYPAAAAEARNVGEEFYTRFADTLDTGGPPEPLPRRVLELDLNYEGSPPSVFDLVGRFWGRPAPAVPPAETLPDVAERHRFVSAGWTAREFALSTDAAAALIGRGVPFLVALAEVGGGPPRLAVGADAVRATLFLADGADRRPAEAPVPSLIERFGPAGPRCLAVVPPGEDHRLAGLDLPESAAYDRLYQVTAALLERRFADAQKLRDGVRADFPGHRVAKLAAVYWARATDHPVLQLDAVSALLADTPHDPALVLAEAAALRDLGRTPERLTLLRAEGDRPDADPLVLQSLAQMLLTDPRHQAEAERLLRRSVRLRPQAAAGYFLLATQRWERGEFGRAADLYRFAACLDEREEQFADAYVRVAAARDQTPDALRLFQQRATRAAVPSPPAVKALFGALLDRDEPDQAFAAVAKAVEKLASGGVEEWRNGGVKTDGGLNSSTPPLLHSSTPEGEVRLFRAEAFADAGRFADADSELDAAKPESPPGDWHRAAARVARTKPDLPASLAHVRAALALDPLDADLHRVAAGLLTDTAGRAAARRYLDDLADVYPTVYPLARLRAEFLYREPDDAAIAATEHLLTLCPADAWTYRQLALVFAERKRPAEALAAITRAGELEPDHPSRFAVLAHVHRRADRTDDALAALRAGLRIAPDHEAFTAELVGLSRGPKEKRAALRFVAEVLRAAPHTGDGLVAYFEQAARLAEDGEDQEEALAVLEEFLDRRPDLWQAWSAVIHQLALMHRAEEAVALAKDAAGRFPLSARLWVDLAEANRLADRPDDQLDALRRAAAAAPGWPPVAKELADALAENDDEDGAVRALQRAVSRSPLDPVVHWLLADRLWTAGRSREALDRAKLSVRHEPAADPNREPRPDVAWGAVQMWSDRLDEPQEAVELARELVRTRAGDPRAWLRLARCLHDPADAPEVLAALDQVIALDPKNVEAYDLRAERLAQTGRFDEALLAARPDALGAELPLVLQGRAAWVEARRGNYAAAIPPMQALVAVDPEYVWGWRQLAEWYNETGRPQNYLEAAGELARLWPDNPVSLTMRGEAKLQTGDRAGGKADLKEVLRAFPNYSPAAVVLFDACLADNERRDARSALAVLQEYLIGPEVVVKQLQYAARTGDPAGAGRALAEVARQPGEGPPLFLQMALAEMSQAGLTDQAAEVLREAWESGEPFNPWAGVYWLDTPAAEAAGAAARLAACDAVTGQYPGFVPGHDRRAEHLASAGRFAEAAAACAPANLGPPVPVALRGRAAWVAAKSGDVDRAIREMSALLAEEPDYAWGWRQLTIWYDTTARPRDFLRAADQLVRLGPDDAFALGLRGEARRAVGDLRGAADDFRRAFERDPSFDAAGLQLVAVQLATDDVVGAARTVNTLREHADGPLVKLRAVQVAARQGELGAARSGFRSLGADPAAGSGLLRDAAAALVEAGWVAELDDDLTGLIADPAATPAAAGLWAEREVAGGRADAVADRLPGLIGSNRPAARSAAGAYALAVAEGGRADAAVAAVQRYADLLREDDDGWAKAGDALAESRRWPLAAAWLGDWADRSGVRPGMLVPLLDALRALGRDAAAAELLSKAAARFGADDLPVELKAWRALAAAVDGRADGGPVPAAADRLGLDDGTALLYAMAAAVRLVRAAPAGSKGAAFAEAKEDLRAAAGACGRADVPPGAGRWWPRLAAALAAEAGTIAARLWAVGQRVRPWVREG